MLKVVTVVAHPVPVFPAFCSITSIVTSQYLLEVKDVSDLPEMNVKETPPPSAAAVRPPLEMMTFAFLLVELHVVAI